MRAKHQSFFYLIRCQPYTRQAGAIRPWRDPISRPLVGQRGNRSRSLGPLSYAMSLLVQMAAQKVFNTTSCVPLGGPQLKKQARNYRFRTPIRGEIFAR